MELIREIDEKYKIEEVSDTKKYLKEFMNEDREFLIVLGLDSGNRVLYREIVAVGNLNSCLIHPREVFKKAIMSSCNSIIVAHNHPDSHPSNITEASESDKEVHKNLIKVGKILGIKVLDCLIIAKKEIISFK